MLVKDKHMEILSKDTMLLERGSSISKEDEFSKRF